MEKKYKILGEFIKDISAGTKDIESYIYTKENKIEKISKNKKSIIAKKIVSKIINVLN